MEYTRKFHVQAGQSLRKYSRENVHPVHQQYKTKQGVLADASAAPFSTILLIDRITENSRGVVNYTDAPV